MSVLRWIIDNILGQTALFMGILAAIGLIVQKKKWDDVLEGVLITITGHIMFNAGTGILAGAIAGVNSVILPTVSTGAGVYPFGDNVLAWAYSLEYVGQNIMPIFIIAWFIHILAVRVFHKWFKAVYLTVHMMLNQVVCNMLFFYYVLGFTGLPLYAACIAVSVVYWTVSPMVVYKEAMELSHNSFALGHLQQFGAWFGGKLAGLVGDPEKDNADELQLPQWLKKFSSNTLILSTTMPIIFVIIGVICAIVGNAEAMAVLDVNRGTTNPYIWYIMQGFTFSAGVAVLQYGLRMFLGAFVPTFQGFSEKLIPGCVPALDCVAFFGFSPMGVVFSFLAYSVAGVLVSMGTLIFSAPVFVYPSVQLAFFDGGAIGVFANRKGGWKGCLLAGFVCGLLMHLGALVMAATGMTGPASAAGLAFGNFDTNVINTFIFWIIGLFTGK